MRPPAKTRRAANWRAMGCELVAEVLSTSGSVRIKAHGASMLPAVWPGDILLVRREDCSDASPGNIILFGRQGQLVAHRVVERRTCPDGVQWVTRGDSIGVADAPVLPQELLGRVVAIDRGTRTLTTEQSIFCRITSWVLSRSRFAIRVLLGIWCRVLDMKGSGSRIENFRSRNSRFFARCESAL